jgi:hypothetical protein
MGRTVKIYQTESYTTYIVREPISIDLNDYPELEGMTNDEIVEYLKESSFEMKAQNEDYDSLSEELEDRDILKDKIYGEECSYKVED